MRDIVIIVAIFGATLRAATPLMLAGCGELVVERSGVLNLGVEGMMLMGAASGFAATIISSSLAIGFLAAILAGIAISFIFGVITLRFLANQVACGLAVTIFGTGLSAVIGDPFTAHSLRGLQSVIVPSLARLPALEQQLLLIDPLVYFSIFVVISVHWFLFHTRSGLILRAIGESHDVAHALGHHVVRVRFLAVLFGGAMSGLAGAYLSLVYTPMWVEQMTAGQGWIAVALVVFSTWKPMWLLVGALLFGFVTIVQFQAEAFGLSVAPNLLAMLPYLATVVVLVLISRDATRLKLNAPAALGRAFHAIG